MTEDTISKAAGYIKHRMPELTPAQARDAAMHAYDCLGGVIDVCGIKIAADPAVPNNEIHAAMPDGRVLRFVLSGEPTE